MSQYAGDRSQSSGTRRVDKLEIFEQVVVIQVEFVDATTPSDLKRMIEAVDEFPMAFRSFVRLGLDLVTSFNQELGGEVALKRENN